jgi:pyruvate dehydrogenase E1 component beta subunit
MRELTLVDAIQEAIAEEMQQDEQVFMVGQDIRGSIFPYTKGLVDRFGEDRIIDTPLAESGMYGMAMGAAMEGYRPIVDFMFAGFAYVTYSEVSVATGQHYFLHGSQVPMPIVATGATGAGMRLANDHSMAVHGSLFHQPGWKVAMPSTPYDAKGLFKAAIRDNNPVFIPWHMQLMMERGPVPTEDYIVPLGSADIKREGSDVTVVANSLQLKNALDAAERLAGDISVEVLDPRSFEPFDMETLMASLEKTNRLVLVDEDWERGGYISTISARVIEQGFDLLDAPIKRVTFPNIPIPGGYIEPTVIPDANKIEAAIREVCA